MFVYVRVSQMAPAFDAPEIPAMDAPPFPADDTAFPRLFSEIEPTRVDRSQATDDLKQVS
jgi:hypothetical protein